MPGTYSQILLHIVFSTKRRAPWVVLDVADRLYPYMGGIIRAEKGVLYESAALKIMSTSICAGGRTAAFLI
jgi:hypothetical protein